MLAIKDRLYDIGCKRIEYIPLNHWIPLTHKWKLLGVNSSPSSKVFIIQAGDCYSYSYRLKESFDLIAIKEIDFISSQVGPFYDIKTEKAVMFDKRKNPKIGGLNMAIKPHYIKNLPNEDKRKNIDSWIIKNMTILNPNYKASHNNSPNCVFGVDTQGLNNISKNRREMMIVKRADIFPDEIKIESYIPKDILEKLKECKNYSK